MLDQSATAWPDRVAIVDGQDQVTFQELRSLRDRLASRLSDDPVLGVTEGTRVALFLGESWEHVALLYALFKLGAIIVPLNLAWEQEELAWALRRSAAEVLVAGARQGARPLARKLDPLGDVRPGPFGHPDFPALRAVVIDDRAASGPWVLREMLASGAAGQAPASRRQAVLVLFTSGSSARPKGVLLRQDNLLGSAHFFGARLRVTAGDRWLNVNPYYHTGGIANSILPCHMFGATHYLFPGFSPGPMAECAIAERCTITAGFEMVLSRLFDEIGQRGAELPFQKIATAPGPLIYDRLDLAGIPVLMMYSLTEAGNTVSLTLPYEESERGRMSNGYPLPGVDVRICAPGSRVPLGPGEAGEICFRGWNTFLEYDGLPEATSEAFDEDGYFRSGDYGWLDGDGRLYYRGRYSMMVKSGGENVSELEVENFLVSTFESVHAAAVVGAPDEHWGEALVAFVEVEDPDDFDGDGLRGQCKGLLSGYKIPRKFIPVKAADWPLTPTGKLKKDELRSRAKEVWPG